MKKDSKSKGGVDDDIRYWMPINFTNCKYYFVNHQYL